MKNQAEQNSRKASPKKSFLQYCCPCFSFDTTNQREQPRPKIKKFQQSRQQLPSSLHKESIAIQHGQSSQDYVQRTEAEIFNTGIYIDFQSNSEQKMEKTQYEIMQEEYQKYMNKNKKKEVKNYPINSVRENHLIILGNQQGRLLCRVKSVYLQLSQSSKKKQMQGAKSYEKVNDPTIEKYWSKRYMLFQKFDEGIKLDKQSWFSVTPEVVADHIATKSQDVETVLDAFCGAGGDSIQFGLHCKRVISNDIDASKIKLLINNAAIYGVDNIETLNQDYFNLEFARGQVQILYLAPPWGGPDYAKLQKIQPNHFSPRLDSLIDKAMTLSDNIMMLLPVNTSIQSLPPLILNACKKQNIISNTCSFLIQKIYLQGRLKFILLCFGNKVSKIGLGQELEYIYKLLSDGKQKFQHKRVIKKLREQFGMMFVLEKLFECQKISNPKQSLFQQFKTFLVLNNLMSQQKIQKLQEKSVLKDDGQKILQSKKEQKQRKIMVKSLRVQQENEEKDKIIRLTYNKIEVRGNSQGSPKKPNKQDKIQQTISYISSLSDSKIIESQGNADNYSYNIADKEGVRIESIVDSQIRKE